MFRRMSIAHYADEMIGCPRDRTLPAMTIVVCGPRTWTALATEPQFSRTCPVLSSRIAPLRHRNNYAPTYGRRH